MENVETNVTKSSNYTATAPSVSLFRHFTIPLLLVLLFAILTLTSDMITCVAMKNAKNIHFSTKLYTCLSLIYDCIFVSIILLAFVYNGDNAYVRGFMTLIARIVTALSWVTVSLLLVEKALCFYFPHEYINYAEPKNIVIVTVIIFTIVVILKVLARILLVPWLNDTRIHIGVLTDDGPILTFILGICLAVDFTSYYAIYRVVKQHVRRIATLNFPKSNQLRSFQSTNSIRVIFFVFLSIHLPLFVILVYQDFQSSSTAARYGALVAMLLVCCTNPILYAWRFREIRFICLKYMAKLFPSLKDRSENMRLQIYHIVTSKNSGI